MDKEIIEFIKEEIKWQLKANDSIEIPDEILEKKINTLYDNNIEINDNINNIYKVVSKRYISEYNKNIKKYDEEILFFKERLLKSSGNKYLTNLYVNLINEMEEKKNKTEEEYRKLKSVDL